MTWYWFQTGSFSPRTRRDVVTSPLWKALSVRYVPVRPAPEIVSAVGFPPVYSNSTLRLEYCEMETVEDSRAPVSSSNVVLVVMEQGGKGQPLL
jgi:hypothetical protein